MSMEYVADRVTASDAIGLLKLAIRDLEFHYGKSRALNGVSFDVHAKAITAITWPFSRRTALSRAPLVAIPYLASTFWLAR